jgi:hypothetical protein
MLSKPTATQQFLLWSLLGLLYAWLWFAPVFWNMTEVRSSFWDALIDIFLQPSEPEYMLGAGIDQLGTFWIFGSLPDLLRNGGVMPHIYHPVGWDIGWHTGFAWMDGILSLPLQLLGVPTFYNLHVLFTLASSFVAICWMLQQISSRYTWLDTLCIPVLAYASLTTPFAIEEIGMGRPTQMYWGLSCVFIGMTLKWTDSEQMQWRQSILVGVLFGLSCLVYWFGAVAVGFCVGIAMICQTTHVQHRIHHIKRSVLAGLLSIGVVGVVAFRMLMDLLHNTRSFDQMKTLPIQELNIAGVTFPIYDQIRIHHWDHAIHVLEQHPSTITILTVGLFGCIFPIGFRDRWPWIVAWMVSLAIPITGAFLVGNWTIPTGQSLLQWVFPLLLRCENPERMMVAPTLLSVIIGWHAIRSIPWSNWMANGLSLLLGGTLLMLPTLPTADTLRVSSFVVDNFRISVAATHPGGMIDVPLSRSENTYIQQLFHKQPLLGGPGLNRVQPEAHKIYCEENPLLKGLIELEQLGHTDLSFDPNDIQQLIDDGFTTIIFDPKGPRPSQQLVEQFLGSVPQMTEERTGLSMYLLSDLLKDRPSE